MYNPLGATESDWQAPECKLADCDGARVDVRSTWLSEIASREGVCQTEPISMAAGSAQTHMLESHEVQTDSATPVGAKTATASSVPDEVLLPSLRRMAAAIENAMRDEWGPKADEIEEAAPISSDPSSSSVECVHELRPFSEERASSSKEASTSRPGLGSLVVTSLSWNSTGNVLAAAFGRFDIQGWCTHPGALCTWNISRKEQLQNKPEVTVQLDNCLMCVAFHPSHPALVAGGTFNGDLYVWDLSRDDPQRARSRISEASHREPITQIAWRYDVQTAMSHANQELAYQIVTLSTDGKVLVWFLGKLDVPVYGYELLHARPGSKEILWGGTCMSFSSTSTEDDGTFIVGTEGGAVYRCFMHQNEQMLADFAKRIAAPASEAGLKFKSPVKSEFLAHTGPVNGVHCSPFHRNLFLTAGADGNIRLYNALQGKPIMALEPSERYLFAVQWSPFRPLVLAAGAGDGRVFFYDLEQSTLHPTATIDVRGKEDPVYAVAFNWKLSDYLATSDGPGIKIWKVGPGLAAQRPSELRQLNRLASEAVGDELGEAQQLAQLLN